METAHCPDDTLICSRDYEALPLVTLGVILSALLIANGLLFRTYAIVMESPSWEAARQYGMPYILAEISVILYALRQRLDIKYLWLKFPIGLRYCVLIFVLTFWIGGAFYSEYTQRAVTQNLIFLVHPLFACAVYHLVTRVDASARRAFVLALSSGLVIFCGMIAFAFLEHAPQSTLPDHLIEWQYAIPGFVSVRLFGAICAAIFCFMFAQLLLDEEEGHKRRLPYIWLTLCGAMTIWSGTRNGVVGIAVTAVILMTIFRLRPIGFKSVILLFLSAGIATVLAISLIPFNDPAFMLLAAHDSATTESISGGRASYWAAIWNAYQSVPVFGAGPYASYWIVPDGAAKHVQPHNIMLQFLITWGLPATAAAFAMLTCATWHAHRVGLNHRNALPFLAMLDSLLLMSFFDGTFHFAQPLMLMMISFGVIFGAAKLPDRRAAALEN